MRVKNSATIINNRRLRSIKRMKQQSKRQARKDQDRILYYHSIKLRTKNAKLSVNFQVKSKCREGESENSEKSVFDGRAATTEEIILMEEWKKKSLRQQKATVRG